MSRTSNSRARKLIRRAAQRIAAIRNVHRDERGTVSILTVFALLMFTMLLIMIINVGRHLDDKVRMQNAADASAYSGGVIIARGMNSLAFTNHLLSDVFAMTAFLREGAARNAESLMPEVIAEWQRTAQTFEMAEVSKFQQLGSALDDRAKKEGDLVEAFGEMSAAASDFALPVFEYILSGEESEYTEQDPENPEKAQAPGQFGLIPEFQRTVIETVPRLAQQMVDEIAFRHGLRNNELEDPTAARTDSSDSRGPQAGLMWRMSVEVVSASNEANPNTRTMPVIDPNVGGDEMVYNFDEYRDEAVTQRRELAKHYLEEWNSDKLRFFDREAQLSQFSNVWRIFTCAHLDELLELEYPVTNLPVVIRQPQPGVEMGDLDGNDRNDHIEKTFNYVVTVHRRHLRETGPGLFRNPLTAQSDAVAFSQVCIFLPQGRRHLVYAGGGGGGGGGNLGLGGTFGYAGNIEFPPRPAPDPPPTDDPTLERWPRENWPGHWDMLNQNWTAKLVPATAEAIREILQTNSGSDFRALNLNGMNEEEFNRINTH